MATKARLSLLWQDRAGRFSELKAGTLVLVLAPGLWTAVEWATVGLGPKPITEAIHATGDWAVRFLLLTLAVTPARFLFDWPKLILVRRLLGLSALAYALAHFLLYNLDQQFDLARVASEIALRIYLAIGFLALTGLIALGVTSTDAAIRRLGKRWNSLHRLIYPITALAILHYYIQSKLDVTQPVLVTGFFLWLMGFRLLRRFAGRPSALALAGLAPAAAIATSLVEAAWYGLMTGVDPARVLAANLTLMVGVRPAWWVLAVGLGIMLVNLLRPTLPAGKRRRNQSAPANVAGPDLSGKRMVRTEAR